MNESETRRKKSQVGGTALVNGVNIHTIKNSVTARRLEDNTVLVEVQSEGKDMITLQKQLKNLLVS